MTRFLLLILLLLPSVASAATWSHLDSLTSGTFPIRCMSNLTPVLSVNGQVNLPVKYLETDGVTTRQIYDPYYKSLSSGLYGRCGETGNKSIAFQYSTDYVPPPVEPPTCSDGIKSGAETAVDCGDPACSGGDDVCTLYCPIGFSVESIGHLLTSAECVSSGGRADCQVCFSDNDNELYSVPSHLGVCPSGLFLSPTDSNVCNDMALITEGASDMLDPVDVPAVNVNVWNEQTMDVSSVTVKDSTVVNGVTTDSETVTSTGTGTDGSSSELIKNTLTVTQEDGTKSVTVTETINNTTPGGSGVVGTTTTTSTSYDSAGSVTGSTSSSTSSESTPGLSSDYSGVDSPDGSADVVDSTGLTAFVDRYTVFTDAIADAPIYSPVATLFAGPDTSGKDALFVLPMGSYGENTWSLTTYNAIWTALGYIFLFLAIYSTAKMIMVRGFSGG